MLLDRISWTLSSTLIIYLHFSFYYFGGFDSCFLTIIFARICESLFVAKLYICYILICIFEQVNSSGVMPIIFSTSSLALPGTLARFTGIAALKKAAFALNPGGKFDLYLINYFWRCMGNVQLIAFWWSFTYFMSDEKDSVVCEFRFNHHPKMFKFSVCTNHMLKSVVNLGYWRQYIVRSYVWFVGTITCINLSQAKWD